MNKILVWLVGLFAPIWSSLGADPRAVKLILATKLKVSDRTTRMSASGKKKKKTGGWAEFVSYLLLFFIGAVVIVLLVQIDHLPTALGAGYMVLSVYLAMMLVLELSESIFDTRDVSVLLSRPINDITFSLARGLFVFTYSVKMILAMTVAPFIYLAVVAPAHLPIFFLACTALTVVTTVGILSFYQYLLRKMSSDQFKKLLSTIQMLFSGFFILIYLAPQLAGSLADNMAGLRIVGESSGFVFPSFWIGAWHDLGASATTLSYVQAFLGLAVFGLSIYVYRSQASGYGASLLQLRSSGTEAQPEPVAGRVGTGPRGESSMPWGDRLAAVFTAPGLERASFKFHWAMMLRDRSFKAKVYPGLVIAPLFVVFFIFRDNLGGDTDGFSGNLLFGLYYMTMTVITPLGQARVIAEPSAAWVWSAHPLPDRGPVAYGQYMASLSQFYLPTLLLTVPLFLWQGGIDFLPDILLAMGVSVVAGAIYQLLERNLPFSSAADGKRMGSIGALIGVFAFAAIAGLAHYGLRLIPYGIYAGLVGAWVVALGSLWGLRRVSGVYN